MSQSAKPTRGQEASASRRGWAQAASEGAHGLTAAALARAGFTDPTLVLRWSEVAGADVARVAEPVKFQQERDGAVLTLRCEAGAVVLLQHETRRLIQRLNGYLGANRIVRLKLVTGRLAERREIPRHPWAARARGNEEDASPAPENSLSRALERLGRLRKP